jgi:hypothetical protein
VAYRNDAPPWAAHQIHEDAPAPALRGSTSRTGSCGEHRMRAPSAYDRENERRDRRPPRTALSIGEQLRQRAAMGGEGARRTERAFEELLVEAIANAVVEEWRKKSRRWRTGRLDGGGTRRKSKGRRSGADGFGGIRLQRWLGPRTASDARPANSIRRSAGRTTTVRVPVCRALSVNPRKAGHGCRRGGCLSSASKTTIEAG